LGICIGYIIARTNIHVCVVGYNVPTCFRHLFKMLDTMFQHPGTVCFMPVCTRALYYLRKPYFLSY